MHRHNMIVLGIALLVSVFIFMAGRKGHDRFSTRLFRGSSNGWGYDILVDGKLFIHQESVPAYDGDKGFPYKEQAERTARLIINKLKQGETPVVTTFEIQKIYPRK
jgi:hypothetical protein